VRMKTYTYSEARQNLASLLDKAKKDGKVMIKRQDGTYFVLRPVNVKQSPLNVEGVDTDFSAEDIVSTIREIRERSINT
jgi:hypothetical protein